MRLNLWIKIAQEILLAYLTTHVLLPWSSFSSWASWTGRARSTWRWPAASSYRSATRRRRPSVVNLNQKKEKTVCGRTKDMQMVLKYKTLIPGGLKRDVGRGGGWSRGGSGGRWSWIQGLGGLEWVGTTLYNKRYILHCLSYIFQRTRKFTPQLPFLFWSERRVCAALGCWLKRRWPLF